MSESINTELKSLLEDYNERMGQQLSLAKEKVAHSFQDGEYNNLVSEYYSVDENFLTLSPSLLEAFEKSGITVKELVAWAVDQGHFSMEFEELEDPSKFSGSHINEFFILPWGQVRDVEIESKEFSDFVPSFSIKKEFESFNDFSELAKQLVDNHEYLSNFYNVFANGSEKEVIKHNFNSDIVRVKLSNEDKLISHLATKSKVLLEFEKVLKAHDWDYHFAEGKAWEKGEKSEKLILRMIKEIGPEAQELYNKLKR